MKILMIVTSHGDINGKPSTGVWFSEFSEPFDELIRAGATITVASPRGGPSPVDRRGYPTKEEISGVRDALERLNATVRLSSVDAAEFDGIFVPGGHGPMFDLATDLAVKHLLSSAWTRRLPIAAVCHGPAALLGVSIGDNRTLLQGRRVTSFTRGEDAQDELFSHMPFSLETRISAEDAFFVAMPPKSIHVETDGLLVTGQNPASARATAKAFIEVLNDQEAEGAVV